jgi:hypothetical protein
LLQAYLIELLLVDLAIFVQSVVVLLEQILESVIHQHVLTPKVDVIRKACLWIFSCDAVFKCLVLSRLVRLEVFDEVEEVFCHVQIFVNHVLDLLLYQAVYFSGVQGKFISSQHEFESLHCIVNTFPSIGLQVMV